jgi:hypothetical protein
MQIIDNFLTDKEFFKIKLIFMGAEFPWFYNDGVVGKSDKDYQFTHTLYKNCRPHSSFFDMMFPILYSLKVLSLVRVKANLLPKTNKIIEHEFHTDQPMTNNNKLKTAVFYINSNNGYTKFEQSNEKINSVENRIVTFNNNLKHSGSTCTDERIRVVVNINYIENTNN